ncbi:EamA family transporter [Thermoanaerobacter thermocopriae]|uniref:EamA family transporter n=1 Tax=Thermoanaerobacter thermocopriae TaxID=29350 RepID=UPI00048D4DD7|nr:EamA family transporter [Thermoanaerobacter thermocopriae]
MNSWSFYGILASIAYGVYAIPLKILSNKKYLNAPIQITILSIGIGVLLVGILSLFFAKKSNISISWPIIFWGIFTGVIWALGTFFATLAFKLPSTNVSKLIPLINTNTFIAVMLGIALFKESINFKTITGIILIFLGSILL